MGITATLRRQKAGRLKRAENANKQEVRDRDKVCRFPLCACRLFNLFLEVSHQEHKGIGGDPTGERSLPERMMLLCNWRHKEDRFSIDKHGIRWVPLTDRGSNGPVACEIEIGRFSNGTLAHSWVEIARESAPGKLAPLMPAQRAILESLATAQRIRFS